MKSLIKSLLREHLDELNIKPKKVYSSAGIDHTLYPSKNNPDRLFKVGRKNVVIRWLRVFKGHPEYFPHVFKWGRSSWEKGYYYVEVEKLNTNKAETEWMELEHYLGITNVSKYGLTSSNFRMYVEGRYDIKLLEPVFATKPNLNIIFKRWEQLSLNIVPLILKYKDYTDLHHMNFGYDNNGNLKCLDI